jgi:hypothetical protein
VRLGSVEGGIRLCTALCTFGVPKVQNNQKQASFRGGRALTSEGERCAVFCVFPK